MPRFLIQEHTSFKLVTGTGTNCGTGTADVTGSFVLQPFSSLPLVSPNRLGIGALSGAVCVTNHRATQITGTLSYGYL